MHRVLGPTLLVALLPALAFAWQSQPSSDNFQLAWHREYGLSRFAWCRLDLVFADRRGTAAVHCLSTALDGRGRAVPAPSGRRELSSAETARIKELVVRSALYDGGHVGSDGTSSDGVFETLKISGVSGTVVVVTSGNPTFIDDPARRELLSLLRELEMHLVERGGAK